MNLIDVKESALDIASKMPETCRKPTFRRSSLNYKCIPKV